MTTPGIPASNDDNLLSGNGDSMEQIRELLFGEQQRATDNRLNDTDQRLQQLREQAKEQLAAAEQRLNKRLDTLDSEAQEGLQDLASEMRQSLSALQQQLEQRIDDLQTQLQTEQAVLARQIGEEQDRLHSSKIDRGQMAQLLTQLASQLQSHD